MPFTRDQKEEMKTLIKDTFKEIFIEQEFLSSLAERICEKMGIQKDLHKISEKVVNLEKENASLNKKIDDLEQYTRKANIRINGVNEEKGEDLNNKVLAIMRDKMQLDMKKDDIKICHRIGKQGAANRSIVVKLSNLQKRQQILANRKFLKGTSIYVTEDLTGVRYRLFVECRNRLGKHNVWISNGKIYTKLFDQNGTNQKYVVESLEGLLKVANSNTVNVD